jgi:hypothetical protein
VFSSCLTCCSIRATGWVPPPVTTRSPGCAWICSTRAWYARVFAVVDPGGEVGDLIVQFAEPALVGFEPGFFAPRRRRFGDGLGGGHSPPLTPPGDTYSSSAVSSTSLL